MYFYSLVKVCLRQNSSSCSVYINLPVTSKEKAADRSDQLLSCLYCDIVPVSSVISWARDNKKPAPDITSGTGYDVIITVLQHSPLEVHAGL